MSHSGSTYNMKPITIQDNHKWSTKCSTIPTHFWIYQYSSIYSYYNNFVVLAAHTHIPFILWTHGPTAFLQTYLCCCCLHCLPQKFPCPLSDWTKLEKTEVKTNILDGILTMYIPSVFGSLVIVMKLSLGVTPTNPTLWTRAVGVREGIIFSCS